MSALEGSRATVEQLRQDVSAVVASLPPDPRGGSVEVRAAQFTAKGNELAYDLVLTRDRVSAGAAPMPGVMQLVVAGESERSNSPTTLTLKPVNVSLGSLAVVRGSLPLPDGFRPRETTIQILDRAAGKQLGMRVLRVSR